MGHLDVMPRSSATPARTRLMSTGSRPPASALSPASALRIPTVPGLPSPVTWPFFALTLVHLLAQYAARQGFGIAAEIADLSQLLLLPSLWLVFDAGLRHAAKRTGTFATWWPWAAAALGASWLADLALTSDSLLLPGMVFLGLAHVAHATVFLKVGDRTAGARPGWLPLPYVACWLAMTVWTFHGDGSAPFGEGLFGVAAVAYGTLLVAMAWLATRVSLATAVGGALFIVSDSLIGLRIGDVDLPLHGVLVMGTYLAAQALIVSGLVKAARG